MTPKTTKSALKTALEPFSRPFKTANEIRVVPMRMDAIVAALLGGSYVRKKLGAKRVAELSKRSPYLPTLLEELGGPTFLKAYDPARALLVITDSSVGDFDDPEGDIIAANMARKQFYKAFAGVLAKVDVKK